MSNTAAELPNSFAFDGNTAIDDLKFVEHFAALDSKCGADHNLPTPSILGAMPASASASSRLVDVPAGFMDDASSDEEDLTKPYVESAVTSVMNTNASNNPFNLKQKVNPQLAAEISLVEQKCKETLMDEEKVMADNVKMSEENQMVVVGDVAEDDEEINFVGLIHGDNVEGLVVVEAEKKSRALDLRSVLCLEDRRVFGVICDVFGTIDDPFYLVYPTIYEKNPSERLPVGSKIFYVKEQSSFAIDYDPSAVTEMKRYLKFHNPFEDEESDLEESECESIADVREMLKLADQMEE